MPIDPILKDWLTRPGGLAARLKQARVDAILNKSELAAAAECSHVTVLRCETGEQLPGENLIKRWAKATKLDKAATDELVGLRRQAKARRLEFQAGAGQDTYQQTFTQAVAAAATMVEFQTYAIPGILQTEPYAAAVLGAWHQVLDFDPEGLADAAAERSQRAALLYDTGRSFRFLLWEPALRCQFADPATMAGQLDRVLTLTELPNVALEVIPLASRIDVPVAHGFIVLDDWVSYETWTTYEQKTDADLVAKYRAIIDLLAGAAVGGGEARDLVQAVLEDFTGDR